MTDQRPADGAAAPGPPPSRRSRWRVWAAIAALTCGPAGGSWWWLHRAPGLPAGIAFSNGRLEADEVDIDMKFAGRVSEILADEGTMVAAGQVVARVDTRDLQAQLAQAQSQASQARTAIVQNQANWFNAGRSSEGIQYPR